MTQTIFKDGRDKYVVIPRIISVNNTTGEQNPVFGTSDEELLSSSFPNLSVFWYTQCYNTKIRITHVEWDNDVGIWKALIPAETIDRGTSWLTIAGQNLDNSLSIIPITIEAHIDKKYKYK